MTRRGIARRIQRQGADSPLVFDLLFTIVMFILSTRLFWLQTTYPDVIESDLMTHVEGALSGSGYSLNDILIRVSHAITGGNFGVNLYLGLTVAATMWATACLLKAVLELSGSKLQLTLPKAFLIAAPLIFLSSIYLPRYYEVFYLTYSGRLSDFTQPWHNSTYLLMRLFALCTMVMFFRLDAHYLENMTWGEWAGFTAALVLCAAAKPSFYIAFAPAMLCFLIYDFIRLRGRGVLQMVRFGVPALCVLPVLFFQMRMLFYNEAAAAQESGIEITTAYFNAYLNFLLANRLLIPYLIAGATFVVAATLICVAKRFTNRVLWFGWTAFAISFLQRWFVWETGYRALHGNITWGIKATAYVLTVVCLERVISMRAEKRIGLSAFLLALLPLVLMVISGIVYFALLQMGVNYKI